MAEIRVVSLISEQTIPNILFIREMKKKYSSNDLKFLFLSTDKMEKKRIVEDIEKVACIKSFVSPVLLEPENKTKSYEKLEENENQFQADEIIVNITGGTKMMTLAVYEFFKRKKAQIYYLPIGAGKIVNLDNDESNIAVTSCLTVKEFLASYGNEILSSGTPEEMKKRNEYTQKIYESETCPVNQERCDWCDFRNRLKDEALEKELGKQGKKRNIFDLKKDFFDPAKNYSWEKYFQNKGEDKGKISKSDRNYFLGGWLEELVYGWMQEWFASIPDNALKGDCLQGVKIKHKTKNTPQNENELDVIFTWNNKVYVFECKYFIARNEFNNYIYKFSAINKNFGLQPQAYILTMDSLSTLDKYKEQMERLSRNNIKLITREDLLNKETFINRIKEITKVK